MDLKRIVITGTGVIAHKSHNTEHFWESLTNGKSNIGKITNFDASEFKTQIAAEVKELDLSEVLSPKEAKKLDPFCHYAVAASQEAITQANLLNQETIPPERIGVLIGSGIGGITTFEEDCRKLVSQGPRRISPLLIPRMIVDMSSGIVSIKHNFKGPNFTAVSACASGTHSIGEAFWILQRGDADIMVCGGAEASITPLGIGGFASMKAMSTRNDTPQKASSPFDKNRDGFVMAEGAGVLVLETLESAKKRNAPIIAELLSYGLSADAYHITSPDITAKGASYAINMALKHAKLNIEDIDYINAHGTSTPLNDKIETLAYKNVFKEQAYNIPISSTKSMTGHALGAAGAWESIICALSVKNNLACPTINLETKDEECDLDYISATQAREFPIDISLNVNLGFGGHNAALIFKKF